MTTKRSSYLLPAAAVPLALGAQQPADLDAYRRVPPPSSSPSQGASEGLWPMAPESYIDTDRIWARNRRPIPVCWEPNTAAGVVSGKTWVEQAIHDIYEEETAVRFSGTPGAARRWPDCSSQSLGIRITIVSNRPRSLIGQQFAKNANGTLSEVPTRMSLNFGTGPYSSICSNQRKSCAIYLAAHEFAHAIGFLHEHLRADAPAACKAQFEHENDDPGFKPSKISLDFDPLSITNYCTNIFRHPMPPTRLSALDILAVNHFYGVQ